MRDFRIRQDGHRLPTNIAPSSTTTIQNNDEFVREALQVHNDLRQKHGIQPLRLNNDLSKLAQQWGESKQHDFFIHLFFQFQPIISLQPVVLYIVKPNIVMVKLEKISSVNLVHRPAKK